MSKFTTVKKKKKKERKRLNLFGKAALRNPLLSKSTWQLDLGPESFTGANHKPSVINGDVFPKCPAQTHSYQQWSIVMEGTLFGFVWQPQDQGTLQSLGCPWILWMPEYSRVTNIVHKLIPSNLNILAIFERLSQNSSKTIFKLMTSRRNHRSKLFLLCFNKLLNLGIFLEKDFV